MLDAIRDAVKDEKVIYLFLDNARYHRSIDVKDRMDDLNIEPIYNVAYSYTFNPVERLWAYWKHYFRAILLEKMLKCPDAKSSPLKDALLETF